MANRHETAAEARATALDPSEVETWLFDLDNTLYPPSCALFAQIDRRMGRFIEELLGLGREAARELQKELFREHGTTLRGLMDRHGVEPIAFMDFVHDIDLSALSADPALQSALTALPGRKAIFTNASAGHAQRVLERLGIAHHFEAVFDIVAADFRPKPAAEGYARLVAALGLEPRRTVFIEDSARNLEPAAALGMTTVWLESETRWAGDGREAAFVDHVIEDLTAWLGALTGRAPGGR